ncbi:glutathione-disulfide reductase [Erythrobacter sp.]|jgi:glutathione reductase (NADPH)|uniref:glutathione-disulfide reductase n=1 Tax=Erythrobacter sp. TaxID=1042 RepID=UPI002EC3222F|nr:glutathione-disulfide reductase [Erythrobacter sp.]
MGEHYDYDLFTIGLGSGGTRASRVAAAHGARVAAAEEYRVGGTCVIRGCVPKKMLVYGAQFAEDLEDATHFGWTVEGKSFDWVKLRDHVMRDVGRIEGIYTETLEKHDVTLFHERAEITGDHQITLASGKVVTAKYILLATGARPHVPDFKGHEHVITSNEAFHLDKVPECILILGGGYIANEFAGIFNEFGAQVVIAQRSDTILRHYDFAMRDRLMQLSLSKGIEFLFNTQIEEVVKQEDGMFEVRFKDKEPRHFDCVMAATGRVPNIEGLGLDTVGVKTGERGQIKVDEFSKTNVDYIYAVGDVTDRVQLTPVAIREGQAFADSVFGDKEPYAVDHTCIPSAVFSHPPIAAVGLNEREAKDKYGQVAVYTSDFRPMKNVVADRNERSLIKMICDGASGKILGIAMIGPDAPEIMQAAAVAVKAGMNKADFDATTAIHPTVAEELVLLR